MSTAVCELRSTPAGEPTVAELVQPGAIVRTNYDTGPYRVIDVAGPFGPFGHGCFSLTLTKPDSRSNKQYWINEIVAVGRRLLKLHVYNDDEVFVISKGEIPLTTKTKPRKPAVKPTAEHYSQTPIVTPAARIVIYVAQESTGKFYGGFLLEWATVLLADHRTALVPAKCKKFTSREHVFDHQLRAARSHAERQRLMRLSDEQLAAVQAVEAAIDEQLGKPTLAEPVARKPKDIAVDQIVCLPLEKLHDHPGNPESTEAEIIEMMSWLKEGQQDEPLDVRPLPEPIGHYQVLSGKRRLAAATRLGWQELQCLVRRELGDDIAAASFAARRNIERRTEGDLRKAHWLRYQTTVLGMTVADAATSNGIAQSTASNLMAVGDLCAAHTYWRDLLIAGEMSAAHLRPVKKYRDYPAVMKLIQKYHADDKARSKKETWFAEDFAGAWGTRDLIERTVEQIISNETAALRCVDTIGEEGMYQEPKFDAGELTPAQLKKLKVVSIPAPGDKSDRLVDRCFDMESWRVLQQAAKDAKVKSAAHKSSKTGATAGSSSSAKQRTPAEQKTLDADRAGQLTDRIHCWRHDWLKQLIANRLDQHPLIVMLIRALSTRVRFHDVQYDTRDHAWASLATLTAEQLADYDRHHAIAIIADEEKISKYPRLSIRIVDDLASMAKIDVAAEWSAMQKSSKKPVEFETFFWLHDISQLKRLAAELKVNIEGLSAKKQLVAKLIGQPRALPLPKSIAMLKPAGKKRAKK